MLFRGPSHPKLTQKKFNAIRIRTFWEKNVEVGDMERWVFWEVDVLGVFHSVEDSQRCLGKVARPWNYL